MSIYHRSSEKRRIFHEIRRQEEEVIGSLCRLGSRPISPKTQLEQEKRIRREIANSNERRRMQSINAGFQSLRTLLPHHEGEKLSKAAILQHTSEFIYQLEQDKTRLLSQNSQLKRILNNQLSQDSDGSSLDSPLPKRKKAEACLAAEPVVESKSWKSQSGAAESSDEGIGNMSPSGKDDDVRREILELRMQLERERQLRMILEDQNRGLEAQIFPEKFQELTQEREEDYDYANDTADNELFEAEKKEESEELGTELTEVAQVEETVVQDDLMSDENPEDLSGKSPVQTTYESFTPALASPSPTVPYQGEEEEAVTEQEVVEEQLITMETEMIITQGDESVQLAPRLYHASTSRQNLETIVEAIRHLEGDHLFCDDSDSLGGGAKAVLNAPVVVELVEQAVNLHRPSATTIAMPNGGHEYAIRHQVIHCSAVNTTRPGVIVSNHA